jgi:hypothetical protein
MTNHASLPELKTAAADPAAALKRLIEQPPPNSWLPVALAMFCLLAGTVVVTNTGERFTLDQ